MPRNGQWEDEMSVLPFARGSSSNRMKVQWVFLLLTSYIVSLSRAHRCVVCNLLLLLLLLLLFFFFEKTLIVVITI